MNTDKEIQKLERKIAALKAKAHKHESRRRKTALRKVVAIVRQFGFDSVHQLLEAADTAVVAVSTKRKRAKITAAIRKKVETLLRSGQTVKAVAAKAGISAPSVNVIKAKAGLTKGRKSSKKTSANGPLAPRKIYGPKGVATAAVRRRPYAVKGPKAKGTTNAEAAPAEPAATA